MSDAHSSEALPPAKKNTADNSAAPSANARKVLPWILSFLRPYRSRVLLALVCLLLGSVAWLALGQGVKLLVDQGFANQDRQRLNEIVLLLLGIASVSAVAVFCRFYLMTWLGEKVSNDIRQQVFARLLLQSRDFYAKLRTGEVISRFTADTTLLQTVVGSSLSMALRSGVTVVGGLLMMAFTSWKLTALVLLAVPAVLVPAALLGRKVRQLARSSQDRVADLGAFVDETLHEIHTVQSYGHEPKDKARFDQHLQQVLQVASGRIFYRALLIAGVMLLSIMAIVAVTWVGAHNVMAGSITGGELSAFMFYAVMVAGAAATISEVVGDIQRAVGASERLMELAGTPISIMEPDIPVALPLPLKGALAVQQLQFSYQGGESVLKGLDFSVAPGERVALVGPSGAGKTTLFQLFQRFYLPTAGRICIDGVDIAQVSLAQLRAQFALVPQESVIFADNVLENVRYGRPEASESEVIAACEAAYADEFIREFPQGYHTYLGERGVRLSGGQKQRIAIARAILADRPLLLLDEATSALDAVSEIKVKQALDRLMRGRTTLIIAHRLATVLNADRILVLDKGELVASGDHPQLLQQSPLYREFASLQLLAADTTAPASATIAGER